MEGKSVDEGREVIDLTPKEKPPAARAALDAFAGKPKEAAAAPRDPLAHEPEGDDPFASGDGEIPAMPDDAAQAFADSGKWMAAWKWLSMTLPGVGPEVAQVLADEHHAVLRKVAGYNDKYRDAVDQLLSQTGVRIDLTQEAA